MIVPFSLLWQQGLPSPHLGLTQHFRLGEKKTTACPISRLLKEAGGSLLLLTVMEAAGSDVLLPTGHTFSICCQQSHFTSSSAKLLPFLVRTSPPTPISTCRQGFPRSTSLPPSLCSFCSLCLPSPFLFSGPVPTLPSLRALIKTLSDSPSHSEPPPTPIHTP